MNKSIIVRKETKPVMIFSNETIYTVEDLMEYLHLGKSKIYSLLQSGTIKSLRIDRKYLIPQSAIEEFIATNTK